MESRLKVSPTRPKSTASSPEAAINRCTALAFDQIEDQLRNKTASSAVLVHFLKLETERERAELERRKLESEIVLHEAKAKAIESAERMERLYADALRAFSGYEWKGDDVDVQD